jgi:hypothetical protein
MDVAGERNEPFVFCLIGLFRGPQHGLQSQNKDFGEHDTFLVCKAFYHPWSAFPARRFKHKGAKIRIAAMAIVTEVSRRLPFVGPAVLTAGSLSAFRRNEKGIKRLRTIHLAKGPRMSNATIKHPFEFQERQREQRRKDALINALEAFAPDDHQQAIDEALRHIAAKRQRQEFKNRFDKLPTEEMGLALANVLRRD